MTDITRLRALLAFERRSEARTSQYTISELRGAEMWAERLRPLLEAMVECVHALKGVRPNLGRLQKEIDQCKVMYNQTSWPTIGESHLMKVDQALAALDEAMRGMEG